MFVGKHNSIKIDIKYQMEEMNNDCEAQIVIFLDPESHRQQGFVLRGFNELRQMRRGCLEVWWLVTVDSWIMKNSLYGQEGFVYL